MPINYDGSDRPPVEADASDFLTHQKLDRMIELLERLFEPLHVEPPLHYPLPGDPEPITPQPFEPMTPDDQAAVERWHNESSGAEVEYEPGGLQRPVEQTEQTEQVSGFIDLGDPNQPHGFVPAPACWICGQSSDAPIHALLRPVEFMSKSELPATNNQRRIVYVHVDNGCDGSWCIPENHPDHWQKENQDA